MPDRHRIGDQALAIGHRSPGRLATAFVICRVDPGLAGCVHQIRPARRAHHLARPQRLLNQIIGATRAARRAGGAAASAGRGAATNRHSTEPAYSYCTLLDLCVYADHCAGSRGQREVCQYRTCITVYSKYCVPVNVNGSCERALVRAHAGFTLYPGQKTPVWAVKRLCAHTKAPYKPDLLWKR